MGTSQLLFGTVANLVTLLLTVVNVLAQNLGILTVTSLAGAINLSQWRLNLVIAELHATFLLVRHVAVGTRYATLSVNAMLRHLPTRMLSFQDLGTRQWMDIVVETDRVVVFLGSLASQTLVVWEYQIVSLAGILLVVGLDEVVLHMALGAHQRTHLLMGSVLHVQTATGKGLVEGRTRRAQVHGACIVTVAAANGIYLFGTQLAPLLSVEVGGRELILTITQFAHHAWHIRTLTSPAGSRLHIASDRVAAISSLNHNAWITCTQDFTHILKGVLMATRGVVMAREGIASPQHYHLRTLLEHIHLLRRVILRLKGGVLCHRPSLVLTWVVGFELFVLCDDLILEHCTFIVKHTGHLCSALHQRRNKQSQDEDHCHRSSEENPTLPLFQMLSHNIPVFNYQFSIINCLSPSSSVATQVLERVAAALRLRHLGWPSASSCRHGARCDGSPSTPCRLWPAAAYSPGVLS